MSDKPAYRYTIFPNLHPTASTPNTGVLDSRAFTIPTNSTRESIILAWAHLLRGHLPSDSVVFCVDAKAVHVEFEGGKVEYLTKESIDTPAEDNEAGRYSAVYFGGAPGGTLPQIYLVVDVGNAAACLFASSEIVPPGHPKTLAEQLVNILPALASKEATPIGRLSILNPQPQKLPGPKRLHQLIRYSDHGDKTALDFLHASGDARIIYSYAELDVLSTKFAVKLMQHLPAPSEKTPTVPILLPQNPALYIALLGILKAGAAFVPLNLDAPAERVRFVVNDVAAGCIVTNSSFSSLFTWPGCPPVVIVEGEEDLNPNIPSAFSLQSLMSLPSRIASKGPAYIMYTSGSTGTPKGVPISHSAATQSLLAHERYIPPFERWLQFASPTFDVFVFEMFFPLFRGQTLVGCDRGRLLSDLPGAINALGVDATELTPTVARGLLGPRGGVPGLKVLLTIGEMLTAQVVDEYSGGVLQGMYGPTEAAIHCTLAPDFERSAKVGDVGVPLDTVSAYIIAPAAEVQILPVGWVGELAIGGHQLADGYLNRPDLTAAVFLDTPEHGRLYRTGDRARILPAGRIECLGRVGTGQVKLRGQRIELGEVEEVVLRTPGTKGAVASVVDGTIVVFVGGGVGKAAVLGTCRRWLPGFMLPGDVVVLEELPRLASGKADRKRLDREYFELGTERADAQDDDSELRADERVIAHAVHQLLGVRPSREASLISLGLDSIQAIRLVSALRVLGHRTEVIDILKVDTVAGIADIISAQSAPLPDTPLGEELLARFAAVRSAAFDILSSHYGGEDIADILPCTSIQEALLAGTVHESSAYCNWILLSVPAAFSAQAVEAAFRGVIEFNEVLRTGFLVLDDGFAQVVWRTSRPDQFSWGIGYNPQWSITMDALLEPPFCATLVKRQQHWELSVNIHHALYDGWCWEQVLADFNTFLVGKIPASRPQFRKFVEYEFSRPAAAREASEEHWRALMEGFSPTKTLGLHRNIDAQNTVGTETLDLRVSRADYEAAARRLGVSPQTIIQAAWASLLSFYVSSTDIVFGTVVSGRTVGMDGIEDVLGPTILTLPVRVNVDSTRKIVDVVNDIAMRNRECMVSEIGLREIRKVCGAEGPLFESLLVWQQTLEGVQEGVVRMVDSRDRLEFTVLVEIELGTERITLRTTYKNEVLSQAQIVLILRQLDQLVSGIISAPEQDLFSLKRVFDLTLLVDGNPNPMEPSMTDLPSLSHIVEVAAYPAIKNIVSGSSISSRGGQTEWTEVERMIANIIADVAQVSPSKIGRKTSIFKLGLDSISAIHLSNRVIKAGYQRLDVSRIMRNPTICALAALLKVEQPGTGTRNGPASNLLQEFSKKAQASALEQLGVHKHEIVKILPCTPLQEAMLSQKGADARTYYNHTVLNLKADTARLRRAWAVMVDRHEILRTCFCVTSHSRHAFAQVVLKHHQLSWEVLEVEATPQLIDDRIAAVSESLETARTPYAFSLFLGCEGATLIMSFHHSLYDGFAMDLLLDDVRNTYHGSALTTRGNFDPFLEYMENIDLDAADSFWRSMLAGLEPSSFPDLTGKTKLAKEKLVRMSSSRVTCSRALSLIEEDCRGLSTSLLALGQTGWARLLSSYSGETDVCFGNVVSGRTIPVEGVEEIIAPCFNTVPVRVQLIPGSTNMSIIDSLQHLNTEILPYQLTPLRRIMTALKTEGQHLFDTLFILQHAHQSSFEDLWEEIEDRGEMDFSIVIELVPRRNKNSLDIVLHFSRDILLEEHASVLLRQLDQAIMSTLSNPNHLATDFTSFDHVLLSTANTRPISLTGNGHDFLHSEFERHARENPLRNALEFLNNDGTILTWTFEKLNQAANQVAHYLISLALKRDEAVPLCLEKSPIFYIYVLGVLKAGCAFTPIDPSLPSQRKFFMIQELGAKVILADPTTAKDLSLPVGVRAIDIEDELRAKCYPVTDPLVQDLSPECLAYRLYTSGSTGQPKAVSLEIKSAVQTFRASKILIPWKESSRLLQFAATTFDMCYYDCFMAWSYGFTLCSAGKGDLLGNLEGTIKTLKASLLDLTPTIASTLNVENLPGVEMLYCIGETMTQRLVNDWDGRCINSYGPTEAAMCCTITPTNKQVKSCNIGKPFPTASFFILSRDGEYIVPTFGSGELCIGGPQVAREYHNNPQLTKGCFVLFEGNVVYRTGDLARMLGDGSFEFIGRADDQVKIRGLRVELDEISSVLRDHSGAKDAATIVLKHSDSAKQQLVSFLAVGNRKQPGTAVTVLGVDSEAGEIRAASQKAAGENLPRYMIPGVILIIDYIPRSAAGKVDKRALRVLFEEQDIRSFGVSDMESEDENTWTEAEKKIREVFSQISQVPAEQISRHSTVYEIGLDSISAAQVAMKLKHVGLNISVLDILENPSINRISTFLAAALENTVSNGEAPSDLLSEFSDRFIEVASVETGISKKDLAEIYPCTSTQEGMLSQFLRSKGTLYFNHIVFKLPENIDLMLLRQSWDAIFMAHDMLRTGFVGIDDAQYSFAMLVHQPESASLPWSIIDSGDDIDRLVSTQKTARASHALKALHMPPWGITVFRRRPGDSVLMFSAHHALYDAQSLRLILDDVSSEYFGRRNTARPAFSTILSSILEQTAGTKVSENHRSFWIKQLKGSSISRFPNLCPVRVKSTASHVCSINTSWSLSKVETECLKLGISVHAVGQAAWAKVLSAYMGDTAVMMGVVLSGRVGIENSEGIAFPCVATVPSLCLLAGTNLDLVLELQESNARSLKHQHTPLRSIQSWLGHPQESFFDSIFVYQKTGLSVEKAGLFLDVIEEAASVDYTLSIEIEPTDTDSLLVRATCRDSMVPSEQTRLILDHFEAALMDILQNPNHTCTDFTGFPLPLLSLTPAKLDEIPSDTQLLHKFVEKNRQLAPEKIAFEFATSIQKGHTIKETWTYTQLDQEGNRIANYLLHRGVKTGDIIAICFEKCPEASFAILGILKAGCAFLALDYSAPIDRKAFIMEDSGAKYLLTNDKYAHELQSRLEVDVVTLENNMKVKISSPATPIVEDLTSDNLCYCLYTSGTTGTPKGCELTHENAIQAMLAFQHLFRGHWDAESRFLQFASFHFDVSVLEQYWSWSVGICVTSAPRDLIFQDIPLTINELQITHLDLTPSLAALLRPEAVPSLCKGVFITGGEQLKQEILDTWGETGVIYNGYGPTEVTIGCTMYPRVQANGKPSNIGPQFINVGSLVMAPGTEKLVPRGAIGELCVSGKLVGRGYLNRPSLTEEKFPFLKEFNTRIYRTGDLVRVLYDGTFDFAGRADDQVKLRGQRLEIGEINETLKQADSRVKSVATLVLRHPKQQKDQLVSFIVLGGGETTQKSDSIVFYKPEQHEVITILTDSCRRKLPTYMVPTHFLPISKMPLSVNNKIDNKRLASLYQDTPLALFQQVSGKGGSQESSWTNAEQRIREILIAMTDLPSSEIKLSSTVFELGLDSVSMVGFARRLRKDGFLASTVSLAMQYPGVRQLAAELVKGENTDLQATARKESTLQRLAAFRNQSAFEVCERLELDLGQIDAIVPCTALQEGMILRFLNSEQPLYYNSFSLSLDTSIDPSLLRTAWDTVVRSTGILRTCFCETSDGYAQVVLKEAHIQWQELVAKTQEEVQNIISQEMNHAGKNKNLHQPPLYLLLLRTPSELILVVNLFHALYDGNSLPLIFDDVQKAYHNQFRARPHQFSDIMGHILSVDLDKARKFWESSLVESRPTSFPEHSDVSVNGDYLVKLKPKFPVRDIENLSRRLNCTPQAIFQAAWASVLYPYLGSHFTFGIVVSGRTLPLDNIEDTIGPLFNTIPCFLDVENAISWERLIQKTHRFNSESIAYHHTPLRLINKWMRVSPEKPLFDTLFVYQKNPTKRAANDPSLWKLIDSSTIADYPLALEIEEDSHGNLKFSIVAKSCTLTEKLSLELLDNLDKRLGTILNNPQGKPVVAKGPESSTLAESSNEDTDGIDHGFKWSPEAKVLRKTIAQLANLGEFEVNEDSSIFELGLDSIEAIKLSVRLRSSGVEVSVSTIMRNPTIRKLQDVLINSPRKTNYAKNDNLLVSFEKEVRQGFRKHGYNDEHIEAVYPATPLQEGMIAETLASGYKLYFNHDVLELASWVDLDRLLGSWESVVEKNEILRTSFFQVSDILTDSLYAFGQVVHMESKLRFNEVVLSSAENTSEAIKDVMQRASQDVNILKEPPLRITIVQTPETRYLILSISHALYDGWSMGLLHQDVQSAYFGSLLPRPSCRTLLESIFSINSKESERFWKQILGGATTSKFPLLTNKSSPVTTYRFERQSVLTFGKIQTFCKEVGVTVQSLGQMCWGLVLAHYLGESDVLFGTVLSGRDFESAEEIMFPAMNTIPIRAIIHGDYKDMLRYTQQNSARTLKYQHTPLRQIQKLVERHGQGLFDTLFIYQRSRENTKRDTKNLWNAREGASDVEYNICVEMEHSGKGLVWRNACKSTIMTAANTETLLEILDSLLVNIVHHPDHQTMTYFDGGVSFGNIQATQVRRSTEIVHLNGVRIDLNETATNIKRDQDNIEDSAAIVIKQGGRHTLVIFVTGYKKDGEAADEEKILATAKLAGQKLPHWSIPSFIIPMSTLRHKDNKINRTQLESHFLSMSLVERNRFAVKEQNSEWSPLELTFRSILARVSGLPEEEIERTQTIFHLGLDSISAIRVSAEFRKESILLGVAEILRAATIERMVAYINTIGGDIAQAPADTENTLKKAFENIDMRQLLSGTPEKNIESILPGTAGQFYMLSVWKNSNYKLFMPTFTLKRSRVELSRILSAWESLTRQESILRTTFLITEDESTPLVQVVLRNPKTQYQWYQSSTANNDALIRFLLSQEQQKPVDFQLPPVHLTILNTPVDTIIFLTIHHALYDGVSLPLLLTKFQGFLESDAGPIQTLVSGIPRFLDFVIYTYSQDVQKQSDFWRNYLHGSVSTLVPLKYPHLKHSDRTEVYQPGAVSDNSLLEHGCRVNGVSLHSVFLAAYAKVYAHHLGLEDGPVKQRDELVFGIYLSNRNFSIPDLASMTAPTLNIVPLRVRSPRVTPIIELARQIQTDLVEIGSGSNAVVGLWQIEKWAGVRIDCFFNFLKMPGEASLYHEGAVGSGQVVLEEVKVDPIETGRIAVTSQNQWMNSAKTNLDIEVAVRGNHVDVGVFSETQYLSSKDARNTIEWMCDIVVDGLRV